jgi:putative colanic acid biosynthesis glycosyltransferase
MFELISPLLSVISVGLEPADILKTLRPLACLFNDCRVEIIVVIPFSNASSPLFDFPAKIIFDHGDGVYQAMNQGISASSGDYLWFLNSGDQTLLSSYDLQALLESLVDLKYNSVSKPLLLYGSRLAFLNLSPYRFASVILLQLCLVLSVMPVSHQNILFPRLSHKPFSLSYSYSCDFEILATLLFRTAVTVIFPSPLPIAKLSRGGISDVNRMIVFRERLAIVRLALHPCLMPIVFLGYLFRASRELLAFQLKALLSFVLR